MRRPRYYQSLKALPHMSWNLDNLYNLWSRSVGPHKQNMINRNHTSFKESTGTLFQDRWQSKKLIRAYHYDFIPEKKFIKWFLPERLPDPMAQRVNKQTKDAVAKILGERKVGSSDTKAELAPIANLMFAEVERRIDVVLFRSCFAHSIHAARQLVVHGKVTLNGLKENDPNVRLNPGDMISVDPEAMTILRAPKKAELEDETVVNEEIKEELQEDEAKVDPSEPQIAKRPEIDVSSVKQPAKVDPPFQLPPYAAPWIFIPAYLEVSFATCSAVYVRHPTARPNYSEIASPYDADGEIVRFAWEWYAKRRSRVRGWKKVLREKMEKGKSGWSGMPA